MIKLTNKKPCKKQEQHVRNMRARERERERERETEREREGWE